MTEVVNKKNASITKFGFKFTRGVVRKDVPYDVALALQQDKRFAVTITPLEHQEAGKRVASGETGGRPRDKMQAYALINGAVGQLDIDDETNFTADGRPDARALTRVLGWQVTAADRDAAAKLAERGQAISAPGENEAGSTTARGDVKTKDLLPKAPKPKAPAPVVDEEIEPEGDDATTTDEEEPVDEEAEEDEVVADDEVDEEDDLPPVDDDLIEEPATPDLIEDEASTPATVPQANTRTVKRAPSRKTKGKLVIPTKHASAEEVDPSTAGAKEV